VLLVLAGFGYLAANTHATSRLQLEVEEAHRGRIMALWSVAFLGLRPLASIGDGAIASAAGVRVSAVVLAVPALACAALACDHSRAGSGSRPRTSCEVRAATRLATRSPKLPLVVPGGAPDDGGAPGEDGAPADGGTPTGRVFDGPST
jgi:hypothetical protein